LTRWGGDSEAAVDWVVRRHEGLLAFVAMQSKLYVHQSGSRVNSGPSRVKAPPLIWHDAEESA
jgi:hypothetical protein